MQAAAHRIDEAVLGVDHVERDQPTEHRLDNDDPDIGADQPVDESEKIEHVGCAAVSV